MDLLEISILIATGLVAGIANTVAGGGSLLAVPMLILLGYPATVANATTRPAIAFQNVFALLGFRHGGILGRPKILSLGLLFAACALPGALAGAFFATKIRDAAFERVLAVVMVSILAYTLLRRRRKTAEHERHIHTPMAAFGFVLIGFYGGFIQAGVGFLIMSLLFNTTRLEVAEINAQKVLVVLVYTLIAITVFAVQDRIRWLPAAVLIIGQSAGGYLGSRISVKVPDHILMNVYSGLLLLFAGTLFF